ncbi:hypothetical protein BJ973_006895 [Actinoplanes tereljensis]|uniref:Uncharacterized protein n=1 Tax=Paractinoplanes tereljensis TaxID=571912 RepID=A0A919NJY0_9ACTN|nr:hypothetical protein [Actinoplanes tereljensis]GIF19853.1 hypothetical protein Ate02nite_25830 [Actinoplanes tereljensis]
MSGTGCSLAALLEAGGPVRVALRPCCLVALVGPRNAPASAVACAAAEPSAEPAGNGALVRTGAEPTEGSGAELVDVGAFVRGGAEAAVATAAGVELAAVDAAEIVAESGAVP